MQVSFKLNLHLKLSIPQLPLNFNVVKHCRKRQVNNSVVKPGFSILHGDNLFCLAFFPLLYSPSPPVDNGLGPILICDSCVLALLTIISKPLKQESLEKEGTHFNYSF